MKLSGARTVDKRCQIDNLPNQKVLWWEEPMSGNLIQLHRDTDKSEKTWSSFANNSNETECNQKHFSKLLIPNNAEKVEPQPSIRVQAPTTRE